MLPLDKNWENEIRNTVITVNPSLAKLIILNL